jgi:hypothetical protein
LWSPAATTLAAPTPTGCQSRRPLTPHWLPLASVAMICKQGSRAVVQVVLGACLMLGRPSRAALVSIPVSPRVQRVCRPLASAMRNCPMDARMSSKEEARSHMPLVPHRTRLRQRQMFTVSPTCTLGRLQSCDRRRCMTRSHRTALLQQLTRRPLCRPTTGIPSAPPPPPTPSEVT